MDMLWAPWRMQYLASWKDAKPGCFLCDAAQDTGNDREQLVVKRLPASYVILNKFPYANGHLMVAPRAHLGTLEETPDETLQEMMREVRLLCGVLRAALGAEGFNVGFNLGKAAGAGVKDHIHLHIVPRWLGDTNFMPILTDTKVLSQSLDELWRILHEKLA